jgi:hypothetical protein
MRVNFYVACINHQPFKIRIMYQDCQQPFPNPLVPPSAKAAMRIFPITIIRRQVSPRSASTQYPKYGIDKQAVIAGIPAPCSFAANQMGLKKFPCAVRYVVTPMCYFHNNSLNFQGVYRVLYKTQSIDDTLSGQTHLNFECHEEEVVIERGLKSLGFHAEFARYASDEIDADCP